MKRAICVLAALLLLMTAHAAAESATVDQPGGSATIDVKAVYRETADEYVYKEEVSGGEVSVTTDEGITVTVSGDEDVLEDGLKLTLRVIPEEDAEAYGWFSEVLEDVGDKILPLDIYFEKDGQRVEINGKVTITIDLPEGYENPVVCYVSSDGKVEVLKSTVKDGKITFEVDHFSFYALVDKGKKGDGAKTGEDVMPIFLASSLALFSFYILLSLLEKRQGKIRSAA